MNNRNFLFIFLILCVIGGAVLFSNVQKKSSANPQKIASEVEEKNIRNILTPMNIQSSVFQNGMPIPEKYTCDGNNTHPALSFSDVPEDTKSLVLLMDDPDVPKNIRPDGMWDHWIVFNMPPSTREIGDDTLAPGIYGKNTSGKTAYGGPCPPDKEHRYFFKLYALDGMLDLSEGASKKDVEQAMEGHILAKAELMGTYNRQK